MIIKKSRKQIEEMISVLKSKIVKTDDHRKLIAWMLELRFFVDHPSTGILEYLSNDITYVLTDAESKLGVRCELAEILKEKDD